MKKLLYIIVNLKLEEMLVSKKVGRVFVNRFLELYNDFKLEELDFYNCYILCL